jgi:NADPH:quinone reductase-like Zn-dependent oxidoreductase
MRAICLSTEQGTLLQEVEAPPKAEPNHLIIKMEACGINPGDLAFIRGAIPRGFSPESVHDICGVSGAGEVIEIGENVPENYKGRKVAVYRSLKHSDTLIGTWSEIAHMHIQHCVTLPDNANTDEYSGSLVNAITPYAFHKQITAEGHGGIICTAGLSATGRAMLAICLTYNIPIISIVRNKEKKDSLQKLNATNILIQDDPDFETQLEKLSIELNTTAVFDGVGGELISRVAKVLPRGSTIYSYGFLGGQEPLSVHTSLVLMKNLTIKGFGNFTSETVQNAEQLGIALKQLSEIISMPHFKTKVGKTFQLEEFKEAMEFTSNDGGKAVMYPFKK